MNKSILFAIFLTLSLSDAYARIYSGIGYGSTMEKARHSSQAALSETLWVEIKSEFSSVTNNAGVNRSKQLLSSYSELPLLGAESDCMPAPKNEFLCETSLDSIRAEKLYRKEIDSLSQQIKRMKQDGAHNGTNDRLKYQLLSDMVLKAEKLQQFQRVIGVLNPNYQIDMFLDINEVKHQLLELEDLITDLQIVAKSLTRQLPNRKYFIYPAVPEGSSQTTQLGQVLRDHLQQELNAVQKVEQSDAILKGRYHQLEENIVLNYSAFDKNGSIVASPVVKISSIAYKGLGIKASSIDFESLLHQGYVVSNEFRADLNTNLGKESLLFESGDEIELFIKLNQPGYFYIVSHNVDQKLSYLLELNDSPGRRAFVSFVNADDANRWISLGKFEVTPPFGTEHLQLIASNVDLVDKLPSTRYDTEQQLYLIDSQSSQDAVIQTRALKPKRKLKQKSAEGSLTYTTANSLNNSK